MSQSDKISKEIFDNPELKFIFDSQLSNQGQFSSYFEDPQKIMKISRKLKALKEIENRFFTLTSLQTSNRLFSKNKTLNEFFKDHLAREKEIAGALSGHLIIREK